MVFSSFSAAVMFVMLSERVSEGVPLLAKKRRRVLELRRMIAHGTFPDEPR